MPTLLQKFSILLYGDLKFAEAFYGLRVLYRFTTKMSQTHLIFYGKYLLVLAKAGIVTVAEDRALKVVMPDYDDVFK